MTGLTLLASLLASLVIDTASSSASASGMNASMIPERLAYVHSAPGNGGKRLGSLFERHVAGDGVDVEFGSGGLELVEAILRNVTGDDFGSLAGEQDGGGSTDS
jgi:hypothetical protein